MRFRGAVVSIVRLLSIVPLLAITEIGSAASEEQASQGQAAAKASGVVVLNGDRVTLADIVDIAEGKASIEVSAEAMERIRLARGVVDHYIEKGLPAYGSRRFDAS